MKSIKENYLMNVKGTITSNTRKFKKYSTNEEKEFLKKEYPNLDPNDSLKLYIQNIKHKKCKTCNNDLTLKQHLRNTDWCSNSCHTKWMHEKNIGVGSNESINKKKESLRKVDWDKRQEKIEETNLKKYGCKNVSQAREIRQKIEKRFYELYGNKNILLTDQFKQTMIEKYGVENNVHRHIKDARLLDFNNKDWLNTKHNIDGLPLYKIAQIIGVQERAIKNKFVELNIPYKEELKSKRSKMEIEVEDFINYECGIKTTSSNRSILSGNKELDIVCENKKLAIEFNGIYWHSIFDSSDDTRELKNRHLNKTIECEEKGYQLLHIFENEWINKKDLWKSVIKSKLGIYDKKYYARNLEIRNNINKEKVKRFLHENHLQGMSRFSFSICLVNKNEEIIQCATFGKSRYNSKDKIELLRMCTLKNTQVIGGMSKILKTYSKKYDNDLISYANRRWSYGKVYDTLGFSLHGISKPCPWYWNRESSQLILEHRSIYMKHKLKDKLTIFDDRLTASENIFLNNYGKIYDCGNLVYIYKKGA